MKKVNTFLIIVEVLVMGGIFFALISPLFSPEEEEEESQIPREIYLVQSHQIWYKLNFNRSSFNP